MEYKKGTKRGRRERISPIIAITILVAVAVTVTIATAYWVGGITGFHIAPPSTIP